MIFLAVTPNQTIGTAQREEIRDRYNSEIGDYTDIQYFMSMFKIKVMVKLYDGRV